MNQVTQPRTGLSLRLEGVRNFRDLGGTLVGEGLRFRRGVLYRSGHFGAASAEDWRVLGERRMRFIDLRQGWEVEIEGAGGTSDRVERTSGDGGDEGTDAVLWASIRSGRLEEIPETLTIAEAQEAMIRLYAEVIATDPAPYARFLASLSTGELPVVVHCSAGKDRTGWAVAVLLTALGAPETVIYDNYAESSLPRNHYIIRTTAGEIVPIDGSTRKLITPLLEARRAYLDAAWASVERAWGSRTSYLERGLGLTPQILAALRNRLLV